MRALKSADVASGADGTLGKIAEYKVSRQGEIGA
jgi:hypothetical protein